MLLFICVATFINNYDDVYFSSIYDGMSIAMTSPRRVKRTDLITECLTATEQFSLVCFNFIAVIPYSYVNTCLHSFIYWIIL